MTKYKGPAKPLATHRELISDAAEMICYALLALVVATILYLE